jgi:hypothetical protein
MVSIWEDNMMKKTLLLLLMVAISACGGGNGSAGPSQPPAANVSPGGIWSGLDSSGSDIIALITEAGRFHFINEDLSQGSGVLSVTNGNRISGTFQLVTQLGSTFIDGTTSANCTFTGSVVERQTITATVNCTTTAGLQTQVTATLAYEALYDRDSSLALVSGNYQAVQEVLNVAGDGTMFSQNAGTGCVVNGQISIINAAYNAYDVSFTYSNCLGQEAILNGSTFTGLALLDNTEAPENLGMAVTGDVAGVDVSLILILDRI